MHQQLLDYYNGTDADASLPNYLAPFHRDRSRRNDGKFLVRQTENNWVAGCDSDGLFFGSPIVISPNGTKYKMNRFIETDYNDAGQLTRIHSNDNRNITISYVPNTRNISKVTANGRTWTYQYRKIAKLVSEKYVSSGPNSQGFVTFANRNVTKHELSLHKVILPDGTYWEYDIRGLTHFGYRRPDVSGDFNNLVFEVLSDHLINTLNPNSFPGGFVQFDGIDIERVYPSGGDNIFVKHPYGTRADYVLGRRNMGGTVTGNNSISNDEIFRTLLKRTISGPRMPTSIWEYEIEEQINQQNTTLSQTLITTIRPDGTKELRWCYRFGFLEGKIKRIEIRDKNNALVEARDFTYTNPHYVGHTYHGNEETYSGPRLTNGVVTRHEGASYEAYLSERKITRGADV